MNTSQNPSQPAPKPEAMTSLELLNFTYLHPNDCKCDHCEEFFSRTDF